VDDLGSDSTSDSWEEEDVGDEHMLRKIRQAIAKGVPITLEILAEHGHGPQVHEAIFARECQVAEPQEHTLVPYQLAYKQIEQIGRSYQGGIPASCIWTDLGLSRDQIDIMIHKRGAGIYLRYGFGESSTLDMTNLPEHARVALPLGRSVTFGASAAPMDGELTERVSCITSQLNALSTQYEFPWQIRLERVQLRSGEFGDSTALAFLAKGKWNEFRQQALPLSARKKCLHLS
jgi:hypothetical protein